MAEINSLTGATAPIPHNEGTTADRSDRDYRRAVQRDDIDGATANAMGLLDLVRWITDARQALDSLGVMSSTYPEVADHLANARIYLGEFEWSEYETLGLQRLHLCIRDELRSTRATAGLTEEAQQ